MEARRVVLVLYIFFAYERPGPKALFYSPPLSSHNYRPILTCNNAMESYASFGHFLNTQKMKALEQI